MPRRLLLVAFGESFASVLLVRGLYFYTDDLLGFSRAANLGLALLFGACYVVGAFAAHPIAKRSVERRVFTTAIVTLAVLHAALAAHPVAWLIWPVFAAIGVATGMKWPVLESFLAAGGTPEQSFATIGRFNMSWSLAIPLAVAISGTIIESPVPWVLFAGSAGLHGLTLLLTRRLPARPTHLPDDHPERPDPQRVARYRKLLTASRLTMAAGVAMWFLVVPLLPNIFDELELRVELATVAASTLDAVRFAAFVMLLFATQWRGRAWPLAAVAVGLPVAFAMILFAPQLGSLAWAIGGQVLYGVLFAVAYFGALYYAIVIKNAAVDAGGAHEGLIGLGFALGPLAGLIGLALRDAAGGYVPGMLIGAAPLVLLCVVGGVWPLVRLKRPPSTTA